MFSKCWLSHKAYGLVHDRARNLAQDHRICLGLPSSKIIHIALSRPSLTFLPQRKNRGKSPRPLVKGHGVSLHEMALTQPRNDIDPQTISVGSVIHFRGGKEDGSRCGRMVPLVFFVFHSEGTHFFSASWNAG